MEDTKSRIEDEIEVRAYLQNLKYALENGARITFQEERQVDRGRELRYTNKYTMATLFPNEAPADVLRRELKRLSVENYMGTVQDSRFPRRSEMREFGVVYNEADEVYIKIRVELLPIGGQSATFVMSFHFSTISFVPEMFPYRKQKEDA